MEKLIFICDCGFGIQLYDVTTDVQQKAMIQIMKDILIDHRFLDVNLKKEDIEKPKKEIVTGLSLDDDTLRKLQAICDQDYKNRESQYKWKKWEYEILNEKNNFEKVSEYFCRCFNNSYYQPLTLIDPFQKISDELFESVES